jgi:hypothetical protein
MMTHCHILTHEDKGMMMVADMVAAPLPDLHPDRGMSAVHILRRKNVGGTHSQKKKVQFKVTLHWTLTFENVFLMCT